MAHDESAYSALGLEPGADTTAIERAYKRLIKQHHPDRPGGDSDRAAEINWAYSELRSPPMPCDTLVLVDDDPLEERGGGWIRAALVLLLALAALLAITGPGAAYMRQLAQPLVPTLANGQAAPTAISRDTMDQPLHVAAVAGAVGEAVSMLGKHDALALLSASRDCHRALRSDPSVTQLDRCSAFDDAIVQLQNRDPMWDQGPFSQIAVTSRQWSAASALSNDYLAIDSRLDRIRVQVELALAPVEPPRLAPEPSLTPMLNSADTAGDNADAVDGNTGVAEPAAKPPPL
ncbi:MAG: J domain-containing protein [Sphingomicrobium sp.]